jgi:hypothetical protein
MTPAEIMAALGVTKYKISPARPSSKETLALAQKYGTIPAGELEDWNIGPYCDETSCRVPYGVAVGNDNAPVSVFLSFHDDRITEIDVSFSQAYWDEILPILDQKYGADWDVDRFDMPVDFETKKSTMLQRILLKHITSGTNRDTNDRYQISATNLDIVFQHHDAYGPYHSLFVIKLVSKNF